MLEQLNHNPTAVAALKAGQRWLPKLLTWLLIGLCLWLLAGALWFWIPHPELPQPTTQSPLQLQSDNNSPQADINRLIRRQLFGKAETAPKVKPEPSNNNAPETRLNLKLAGIILADDAQFSRALIAGSNGKQKPYAIGDAIDGASASLHEVHAEHVVLERNGRYETLRLQKLTSNANSGIRRSSSSRSSSNNSVSGELKSIREQLLKDPSKAGDFIRVRPVYSKGQLKGYRVYPGKDRALFRKVGLRSGDLVTAVNGQSLNDPQKAFTMLSTLSSATNISLELQRRGRTETVSVDLGS